MEEYETKLSVIIPVYNVEKYLKACLESVLVYKKDDIEIICINDSSTDSSLEILNQYRYKDDRIKIYSMSSTVGPSGTRNYGVNLAKGKYILFLDSDDRLEEDAIPHLINIIETKEYDIVFFNYNSIYESDVIKKKISERYPDREKNYEGEWKGMDLFCQLFDNGDLAYVVWSQLYKRSFLEMKKIRFIDGILHEDIPYSVIATLSTDNIYYTDKVCYLWLHRESSITSGKSTFKHIEGRVIGLKKIIEFIENNDMLVIHYDTLKKFVEKLYQEIKFRYKDVESREQIFVGDYNDRLFFDILFMPEKKIRIKQNNITEIERADNIIIYGAGRISSLLISYLNEIGKAINGIVVTDKSGNPDYFYGHKIYTIEELADYKDKSLVCVALSTRFHDEVRTRLNKCGFKNILFIEYEFVSM